MANSQLLERAKITLKTGQWWEIPWWRADGYYKDGQIARDGAEEAFSQLKETFDVKWILNERDDFVAEAKKWLKEHDHEVRHNTHLRDLKEKLDVTSDPVEAYNICQQIGLYSPHPLFYEFFAEGLLPLRHFIKLGSDLLAAKKAGLLSEDLIKRIKHKNEYLGAYFELEFLSHLIRRKCAIDWPDSSTGNKKADFKVSKGMETLFIELKKIHFSSPNRFAQRFTDLFFQNIFLDPIISSVYMEFDLSDKLRVKVVSKRGQDFLRKNGELIVKQIKDHIIDKIQVKKWGNHVIPGLARYEIQSRDGEYVERKRRFSAFSYFFDDDIEELLTKKIFRNAVTDALKQLPKDSPGILIVNTPPLDLKRFGEYSASRFQRDNLRYQQLSAIILVYAFASYGENIQYQFNVIINPSSTKDVSNYAIVKHILTMGK